MQGQLNEPALRRLAYAAVGAVWLFAGCVGVGIGRDIGRAIWG